MNIVKWKNVIQKWKKAYTACLRGICGLIFGMVVCITIYKVFTRYFIPIPTNWTEDISTLSQTWLFAFGITALWLTGEHLVLEVTDKIYPKAVKTALWWLSQILALLGALRIIPMALYNMNLYNGQRTTLLRYNEAIRYLPIFLAGVMLAVAAITNIAEKALNNATDKGTLLNDNQKNQ